MTLQIQKLPSTTFLHIGQEKLILNVLVMMSQFYRQLIQFQFINILMQC